MIELNVVLTNAEAVAHRETERPAGCLLLRGPRTHYRPTERETVPVEDQVGALLVHIV